MQSGTVDYRAIARFLCHTRLPGYPGPLGTPFQAPPSTVGSVPGRNTRPIVMEEAARSELSIPQDEVSK